MPRDVLIQVRRSSTSGQGPPSDIQPGEPYLNTADRRLWVGVGSGQAVEVTTELLPSVAVSFFPGLPSAILQPSGNYIIPFAANAATLTTLALTANQIRAAPFAVRRRVTITQVALNVSTAATGTTVAVAIYGANADGTPGTRVWVATGIDSATTGNKTVSASLTLGVGLYWLAVWSAGAPALRAVPTGAMVPMAGFNLAGANAGANILTVTATGGLTDPFPSGYAATAGAMPAVGVLYTVVG